MLAIGYCKHIKAFFLLLKMTKQSIWDMAIAHQAEKHQLMEIYG